MSGLGLTTPVTLGEKTSVSAARVLREAILSGQLPPGAALGEQSLGRQLGISRTPVREALLLLRGEGLVEMPPNRPAIVRSFSAEDLREMHSLRALLEGYAARTAAARLTEPDIAELTESCERYARLGEQDENLPQLVEENFRFHDTIVRAAASDRLVGMIRQVTAMPLIYKSYMTYSSENRATALADHRNILAALTDRDPDRAELAMKSHVMWARDVALAHLPQLEGAGEA
jgi:DNA-binding GntR family transcriptional regulator